MSAARKERLRSELRQEVLDAARDLIVKDGYEATSMRKIAERVGVAPGTIYLHFQDKLEIVHAICMETFQRLDRAMEAIANDRSSNGLDRLRRGMRRYIEFGLEHRQHYVITFSIGSSQEPADLEERTMRAGLESFSCLVDVVQQAIDQGHLRSNDADEVAQSLWAMAHGLVMLLIQEKGFPFVEQSRLVDSVVDIMIEGVRKKC